VSNHDGISQYEYEDFEIIKQRSTSFNKLKHRLTVPCSQVRKSLGGNCGAMLVLSSLSAVVARASNTLAL